MTTARPTMSAMRTFAALCLLAMPLKAIQAQISTNGRNEVFAGSDLESYLRYLQTSEKATPYPWSIRAFSPSEIDAITVPDSAHPWASRFSLGKESRKGFSWDYVRPRLTFYLNSSFPYGGNDGIVWQGKGLTTSFQTGVSARWGPLSATLAPVAFRAENQSFPMMPNGESTRLRFADGQFPLMIDRPQRFGTTPYSRIDLGESTVRADLYGVTAGISTASQWWGPTDNFPYVLGNNAGGFPHVFFGTSKPANLWIARFHARVVYGELDQSQYSPVIGPKFFENFGLTGRRRFMAGLVALIQPRGAPGLEIGGARFFHAALDSSGVSAHNLGLPFQNLLKYNLKKESDTAVLGDFAALKENQLAALYIRWAPPGSGLDIYGEYGREDHAGDKRDFFLEIDHSATQNFGIRKAWFSASRISAVRAEVFNFESPAGSRTRGEGGIYLHGVHRQGHTNRGQLLGANVGVGSGSAQLIAFDRFTKSGKLTAFFVRNVAHEALTVYRSGLPTENAVDVMNSIGAEMTRFIGPIDVTARATITGEINRNLRGDRTNGNFFLSVRQNL
jgi:hypothetical protein